MRFARRSCAGSAQSASLASAFTRPTPRLCPSRPPSPVPRQHARPVAEVVPVQHCCCYETTRRQPALGSRALWHCALGSKLKMAVRLEEKDKADRVFVAVVLWFCAPQAHVLPRLALHSCRLDPPTRANEHALFTAPDPSVTNTRLRRLRLECPERFWTKLPESNQFKLSRPRDRPAEEADKQECQNPTSIPPERVACHPDAIPLSRSSGLPAKRNVRKSPTGTSIGTHLAIQTIYELCSSPAPRQMRPRHRPVAVAQRPSGLQAPRSPSTYALLSPCEHRRRYLDMSTSTSTIVTSRSLYPRPPSSARSFPTMHKHPRGDHGAIPPPSFAVQTPVQRSPSTVTEHETASHTGSSSPTPTLVLGADDCPTPLSAPRGRQDLVAGNCILIPIDRLQ
ncbi:hypothetical protein FA95DRAFT_1576171 [Auriscalpium vulgare]|uniref:Uncharacterized protein n=1 Tax=Auriscalpium vulgare TaxID=40419 RepID=A0ACB8RDR9_9AGAM|nr:hypothetical protein FA95DRAFT_1576171 [Auriscalpium vulgare]